MIKTPKRRITDSSLKSLLLSKGYTMIDLKCEVALMFCSLLFELFIKSEDENKSENLLSTSGEENPFIYDLIKSLNKQINSCIISIETVQTLLNNSGQTKSDFIIAKTVEPYQLLYNEMIKMYISKKNDMFKDFKEGEKKYWMPDVLGIYIITFLIENGYAFNKFPFINAQAFLEIKTYYDKTNKILIMSNNYKAFSKDFNEMSIISKMRKISSSVATKLIKTKLN